MAIQIIRITTSAQTGQHRYLGVDLFTKQLHEEPCVVSHPSPSVVLHSLLGPVFKQYRLIDIPISNCINSGLNNIYVLTQFMSVSLCSCPP